MREHPMPFTEDGARVVDEPPAVLAHERVSDFLGHAVPESGPDFSLVLSTLDGLEPQRLLPAILRILPVHVEREVEVPDTVWVAALVFNEQPLQSGGVELVGPDAVARVEGTDYRDRVRERLGRDLPRGGGEQEHGRNRSAGAHWA